MHGTAGWVALYWAMYSWVRFLMASPRLSYWSRERSQRTLGRYLQMELRMPAASARVAPPLGVPSIMRLSMLWEKLGSSREAYSRLKRPPMEKPRMLILGTPYMVLICSIWEVKSAPFHAMDWWPSRLR